MKVYFDSRNPSCKTPFGAVPTGQEVTFTLAVGKDWAGNCRLCLMPAHYPAQPVTVPMELAAVDFGCNYYRCTFAGDEPQLWFYHFELVAQSQRWTVLRDPDGQASLSGGEHWQLTVYDRNMKAPSCFGEGVMYQIFPDRFYFSGTPKENVPADRILRSDWGGLPEWRPDEKGKIRNNDYFGGDLRGIEEKLDYLESLGVTCLYLNPIFEAHSNHRYDTADYEKIDPLLGSEEDFVSLCREAKKRGISIILDGVFSHTGADSRYFNREGRYGEGGAFRDTNSPYFPWYQFRRWPEDYECWWGIPTLPNVRETEPSYLQYITGEKGVVRKWLRLGASGFRLDVADELPDTFLDALYACVKGHNPDCAVIGEVWEDASNKISYGQRRRYLLGGQMDSVMNYPFRNALLHYLRYGGGGRFLAAILQVLEHYPPPVVSVLMNSLSTHDTLRAITALGGEPVEHHDRRWQSERQILPEELYWKGRHLFALGCILQYGLPGIPCLYYGDEAGMCGYQDPFNRGCYPWGKEDAGLVAFLQILGKIRKDFPIFSEAEFIPVCFSDEVCSFVRKKGGRAILFAVNRTGEPCPLILPPGFETSTPLAGYGEYDGKSLGGLSGVILTN